MTLATPYFQTFRGPVGTIPWNMHAKFEVSIFSHFGAISI